MPELFLSYTGIRVTDLARSLQFYTEILGLREVARGDNTALGGGVYVLLQDAWSGQKLELNWYPPGSKFDTRYVPGEGLDHVAFRVDSVPRFLAKIRREAERAGPGTDHQLADGTRVAYFKDPDGNWIEIFDHPTPIPPEPPLGY